MNRIPSHACVGLLLLPLAAQCATGLKVHEWGTFTTLSSSSGQPLSGLYVDATRLPAFVYGLPFFNFDPVGGWASREKLRNVTVKLETPVLYFYSAKEMDVTVKVGFQGGTISQWYPQCSECETGPTGTYVDFGGQPYAGHIGWKAKVLKPGVQRAYTPTATGQETLEWTAPRNTGLANDVRGEHGEIENFLFYRGLGNFASAVDLAFRADGSLRVRNRGSEDIPFLMIYDRSMEPGMESFPAAIWWKGGMEAGEELILSRPTGQLDYMTSDSAMQELKSEMVEAGLYTQEAQSLLNTWYNGYFLEGGLKAFWIVPRAQVDDILPLEILPLPDSLVRVIVGRSEILTPEFERALFHAREVDSLDVYKNQKYYQAYLDLLSKGETWQSATSLSRNGADQNKRGTGDRAARPALWLAPGGGDWASPWFPGTGSRGPVDLRGRAIFQH